MSIRNLKRVLKSLKVVSVPAVYGWEDLLTTVEEKWCKEALSRSTYAEEVEFW